MNRWIFALVLLLAVAPARGAEDRLSAEQATRDLTLLERAFTQLHPGLTRYRTAESLAADFAAARAEVAGGASRGQMYLLATRLSAGVRCGHTWTNPSNQSAGVQAMLDALPALPVRVRLLQGRLLVVASAQAGVATGDEILAIDGRPIAALLQDLMPYLRADGGNDGKRLAQLDSNEQGGALDRLLPLLHPPRQGRYTLRLRRSGGPERVVEARALAVKARERLLLDQGERGEDLRWRLDRRGNVAVMTLPTFAFWNEPFDANAALAGYFDALAREPVNLLVIDLRQNEGGDSAIGQQLLSYLLREPYAVPMGRVESAYERVPYALARHLDTWDFDFFDRTGQVVAAPSGRWLLREQPTPVVVAPQARPYRGKVVALVGPRMSSAGFLIARDLRASGAATLIGEPTGGNLRGLNGGQLAWLTLPRSGVAVDIPLLATVYEGAPDAGVQPDILVPTRVEDVVAGRDPAMERALRCARERCR